MLIIIFPFRSRLLLCFAFIYKFTNPYTVSGAQDPAFRIDDMIPEDARHLPLSEKIVVYMLKPLFNQGYHVYMDNWYSGLRLYR